MNNKILVVIILIALIPLGYLVMNNKKSDQLKNPIFKKVELSPTLIPSPASTPSPTPKSFKFDKSTDLKIELESVNPQVLESDFQ